MLLDIFYICSLSLDATQRPRTREVPHECMVFKLERIFFSALCEQRILHIDLHSQDVQIFRAVSRLYESTYVGLCLTGYCVLLHIKRPLHRIPTSSAWMLIQSEP